MEVILRNIIIVFLLILLQGITGINAAQRYVRSIFTGPGDSRKWLSQPILYFYDPTLSSVLDVTTRIEESLENWSKNSCLRFKSTNNPKDVDYISFESSPTLSQCSASLGRQGGKQTINISPECTTVRAISMLIGRSLGLIYEIERDDRDEYIIIDNVKINRTQQTDAKEKTAVNFGIPFEYGSLMQFYGEELRIFNATGPVFIAKNLPYQSTIGTSLEPTFYDIETLNRYYCNDTCPTVIQCLNAGYTNPSDCRTCNCPGGYGGSRCNEAESSTLGNLCPSGVGFITITETSPPHSIHSAGWPDQSYSLGAKCVWLYNALCSNGSTGKLQMEVNATLFNITEAYSGQCLHWLEVKYKENQALTGLRLCGTLPQQILLESESEKMAVIFNANPESWGNSNQVPLTGLGFKATISLVPNSCNDYQERENNIYTPWSNWTPCSQPCGGCGIQKRFRRCMIFCYNQKECPCRPVETEFRDCNPYICDISGKVEYECFDNSITSEPRIKDIKKCTRNKLCCDGYLPLNSVCIPPDLLFSFYYNL